MSSRVWTWRQTILGSGLSCVTIERGINTHPTQLWGLNMVILAVSDIQETIVEAL